MPDPDRMRPMTALPALARRAVPTDLPELERPRVRLIHGIVTCPRCGRTCFHLRPRSGETWATCNVERVPEYADPKYARGKGQRCQGRWLNLTLPAGAIGADLARLTDDATACTLIRLVFPHLAEATDAQVAHIALAMGTREDRRAPSHLQITVRGHDEYHYRWATVGEILVALGLR